jgi:hypothetical protein
MSRIYDSSYLTQRKMERATAGSFITQGGSRPLLGITDQSIINTVKTGQMTEYSRYTGCIGISPGCPCHVPAIVPSSVSGITFTVGSIIVSWNAPVGTGPFSYRVTPYLNGVAQPFVSTSETSYRFTDVVDWQPYTFTVCAFNGAGQGPDAYSSTFLAPPATLSSVMIGTPNQDPLPSLQYILNAAFDSFITYVSSKNVGPTRGARIIYLWSASIAQAWNWISSDARISGTHDHWNWDQNPGLRGGSGTALSQNDSIVWMCSVIDYLTPYFILETYQSIYNCPADTVTRVKAEGQWTNWTSAWNTWYTARQADGSVAAGSALPTGSQPQQWTRLTVNGTKQGYLTYLWDNVSSTCLSEANEATIQASVTPATGAARDAEIDNVLYLSENLDDTQKIIAEFWAGSNPGFHSPPLMLLWLWKEYMRTQTGMTCSSIIGSMLDMAIHLFEGSRVTWRLKTAHMEARPIQEIRRRYTGTSLTYWKGTMDGSQWMPYQLSISPTPPFADFPSGHSHFSKAFALTMNKWFGNTITKTSIIYDGLTLLSPIFRSTQTAAYGDFTIAKGDSEIQVGVVPAAPLTLSFTTWNEMANQTGMSRLYGGIHAMTAHTASQSSAVSVDNYIQSSWNIRVGT